MKHLSVRDEPFQSAAKELMSSGEMLVVIRYVYGAGARDFLFVRTLDELQSILARLRPRDSVVLMNSFRSIVQGTVDGVLISFVEQVCPSHADWLILDMDVGKHESGNYPTSSRNEIVEELKERLGHRVRIIEEPPYADQDQSIGAYVPDEDGVVRLGAY